MEVFKDPVFLDEGLNREMEEIDFWDKTNSHVYMIEFRII